MQNPPHGAGAEAGERFAYFMIRTHNNGGANADTLSGIVERLGSGEKHAFTGAEELVRLLTDLPDEGPKLESAAARSNESEAPLSTGP